MNQKSRFRLVLGITILSFVSFCLGIQFSGIAYPLWRFLNGNIYPYVSNVYAVDVRNNSAKPLLIVVSLVNDRDFREHYGQYHDGRTGWADSVDGILAPGELRRFVLPSVDPNWGILQVTRLSELKYDSAFEHQFVAVKFERWPGLLQSGLDIERLWALTIDVNDKDLVPLGRLLVDSRQPEQPKHDNAQELIRRALRELGYADYGF